MNTFEKGDPMMIDQVRLKSITVPIFLCVLLIINISSGLFFLFDVQRIYDLSKYLQIPYVYADTIDDSSSSNDGSLTSSQTLNDDNGGQGPPPDNGGQGPPPDNGGQGPPPDNGGQGPPRDNGGQGPPPGEGQGPPGGEGGGPIPGGGQGPPGGEGGGPIPGGGQGPPGGEGGGPPPDNGGQGLLTEGDCFDRIDGDGDGKIDRADSDCPGGPPPSTVPGQGCRISPAGDRNNDNQFSGNIIPVSGNDDSQTILGTAFGTNLLPIQAEAESTREDNCEDGQDNNHNGLRDSEDSKLWYHKDIIRRICKLSIKGLRQEFWERE